MRLVILEKYSCKTLSVAFIRRNFRVTLYLRLILIFSLATQNSLDALDDFEKDVEDMSDSKHDDFIDNRRMTTENDDSAGDEHSEQSEDDDENENEANDANLVQDEEKDRENSAEDENEDFSEDDNDRSEKDDEDDDNDDDDEDPVEPVPTGKYASCERGKGKQPLFIHFYSFSHGSPVSPRELLFRGPLQKHLQVPTI